MNVKFHPLLPFGAEITGLNLAAIAPPEADALRSILAARGIIAIRNGRQITDADFVAFLEQLGPLAFTVGETPVVGQPTLNLVSNVGRDRPPKSVFHTDSSYMVRPPAYTALRSVVRPQTGGDTLFSDQYRAFATLPSAVKQQLAQAQVLHVVSGLTLSDDCERQSWQPLFRRHPISGRTALFLSTPERCQQISGLTATESQRIIRLLYKHSIRSRYLYRHRWQPNDIVVWDNRCTMHRADHSAVVGDRVLHRGLVAGEVPLGAWER